MEIAMHAAAQTAGIRPLSAADLDEVSGAHPAVFIAAATAIGFGLAASGALDAIDWQQMISQMQN